MEFIGYVIITDSGDIVKRFTNKETLEDVVHYIIMNSLKTKTDQIKCIYLCKDGDKSIEKLVNI